jgi:DNA-binding response OmpR family regulator
VPVGIDHEGAIVIGSILHAISRRSVVPAAFGQGDRVKTDPATQPPASVTFGRFRVLAHRRELLADGRPIKLGGRAFDVLTALIEARGAVVAKDALMARVWPDRIVEENKLQAHLSALREAFGADAT